MSNELKLERPLIVFDIESTGIMPQRDRIVEQTPIQAATSGRIPIITNSVMPSPSVPKARAIKLFFIS